jgi:hypothetical protein
MFGKPVNPSTWCPGSAVIKETCTLHRPAQLFRHIAARTVKTASAWFHTIPPSDISDPVFVGMYSIYWIYGY